MYMDRHAEKTISLAYHMTMATITMFLFSEFVNRGPFYAAAMMLDRYKIKYLALFLSIFINILLMIRTRTPLFKNKVFNTEAKKFMYAFIALMIITIVYQIKNGYLAYSYEEMFYTVLPFVFVVILVNVDYINITRILDNSFYVVVLVFFLCNIDLFNLSSIASISFADSYSPFESGFSLVLICYELYYLVRYGKRETKSTICLILTILTFKRLTVIKGILFFVFVPMIKARKTPTWLFWLAVVVFCLTPMVMEYIYSDEISALISDYFGKTMNQLSMDRYRRTRFVLDNLNQVQHGYGSITYFLTKFYGDGTLSNRSLHCDILKIYLECSMVGTVLFTYFHFSAVRKNIFAFLLMVHVFTEMIINHPFGAGNVGRWIIMYTMFVYYLYMGNGIFYDDDSGKPRKLRFYYR
jgi:hypothetical protein